MMAIHINYRYCNDLEEAFTIVNLINVVLSSVNICCVVFVIVVRNRIINCLIVVPYKYFAICVLELG